MDCPSAVRLVDVLSFLTATSYQHTLRYLAVLETRHYASSTLMAVAGALKCLLRHRPETRRVVLAANLTQTTAHDITHFVSAAQHAGSRWSAAASASGVRPLGLCAKRAQRPSLTPVLIRWVACKPLR
jgi:type VI protein secretion system component VasF